MPRTLRIASLRSGGLVTNYACSSACAHCSYRSHPKRDKAYTTHDRAAANCRKVRQLGCRSMHIGGGEPFLNRTGLLDALEAAREEGMAIEYIETNSSWYRDHESAVALLQEVKQRGCTTLLISIDPYHNAYIPFAKVKGVMAACRTAGISIFPWLMEFYEEINALDDSKTHSLKEYADRYGEDYVATLGQRYSPSMSGRAITTYAPFMPAKPLREVLEQGRTMGQGLLTQTGHFHVDLYGSYLPPGFPGFSLAIEDLGDDLDMSRYPAFAALHDGGLPGFYDLARTRHGFEAGETYHHPRELLDIIARHLVTCAPEAFPDLRPLEYYTSACRPPSA
ncbi:MAG: radical SAM protein [Lentisphaerae bacterium]|jgi:hypothetical protein|nr:radical SAM protein [Lentisphaerota bacterium]MBT5604980.1 radical SAM protein [Lentisphaerota bacterium]MBT7055410.1 radical SAM protein [Lentisphaerota bacterium]MBT7847752.1 radical SAM protein [Lentisphaerota bacterium]